MTATAAKRDLPLRISPLGWIVGAVGVITILVNAFCGTAPLYSVLQLACLLELLVIIGLSRQIPFILNAIVFTFIIKNIALSQVVKAFLLQRPDIGLAAPVTTIGCIVAGISGCLVAYLVIINFGAKSQIEGFAPSPAKLQSLPQVGWSVAIIGLAAQLLGVALGQGEKAPVLTIMSNLPFVGCSCLIHRNVYRLHGRAIWGNSVYLILGLSAILSLSNASKYDLLKVPLFIIFVHVVLRKKIATSVLVLGAGWVTIVSLVAHPIINYARRESAQAGSSTAGTFLSATYDIAGNPKKLSKIREESEDIEGRWVTRLYFGEPLGIMGRFTPNQVDDLVSKGSGIIPDAKRYISRSAVAFLPQTVGFQRSSDVGQEALEALEGYTSRNGEVSSTNVGLAAELYALGGNIAVFLGFVFTCLITYLASLVFVGNKARSLLVVPFALPLLLVPADGNLSTLSITIGQQWVIILTVLITMTFIFRRKPARNLGRPTSLKASPSMHRAEIRKKGANLPV